MFLQKYIKLKPTRRFQQGQTVNESEATDVKGGANETNR